MDKDNQPVVKIIPFGKKFTVAKARAHAASNQHKEKVAAKYYGQSTVKDPSFRPKPRILPSFFQVLFSLAVIVAIVVVGVIPAATGSPVIPGIPVLFAGGNTNEQTANTTHTNTNSQTNNSNKTTQSNDGGNGSDDNSNSAVTGGETPNNEQQGDSENDANLSDLVRDAIYKHYNVTAYSQITDTSAAQINAVSNVSNSATGKVTIRLSLPYSQTSRSDVKAVAQKIFDICKDDIPDLKGLVVTSHDSYFVEAINR